MQNRKRRMQRRRSLEGIGVHERRMLALSSGTEHEGLVDLAEAIDLVFGSLEADLQLRANGI